VGGGAADTIFKIAQSWIFERLLKSEEKTGCPQKQNVRSKRELIEPTKGDKRYVRRKTDGTFGKTVDVGRSLAVDRKRSAKTKVPQGQGDRGDVKK
jgi:hypothetical protein